MGAQTEKRYIEKNIFIFHWNCCYKLEENVDKGQGGPEGNNQKKQWKYSRINMLNQHSLNAQASHKRKNGGKDVTTNAQMEN